MMIKKYWLLLWMGIQFIISHSITADTISTPIMPLSDVRPGMEGYWRTVVQGQEIVQFPLKVIDVIHTFIGPKQPVIFCESLDQSQLTIGTVAGMSGSPVFIDGRLVGAYAYGFPWPKDQVLIGLSPIEEMMKVFDYDDESIIPGAQPLPIAATHCATSPHTSTRTIALSTSGFSDDVLNEFAHQWEAHGFTLKPMGGGSNTGNPDLITDDLEPGAAVAAVLLGGDFQMAAAGTLTWCDGKRFLAFGHPFLKQGSVQIPLAKATVVTIVQSYETSFKLAKIGPVVGCITQDRLTAVGGEIGRFAPTTKLTFRVHGPSGQNHIYTGELFQNREIAALIATMAFKQSLQSTLHAASHQSYEVSTRIDIEGYPSIQLHQTAFGPQGASEMAGRFFEDLRFILSNKFEFPRLTATTCDIQIIPGIRRTELLEVQLLNGAIKPGDQLELKLQLQDYFGLKRFETVHLSIPKNRLLSPMSVYIGTAPMANEIVYGHHPILGLRSFSDIVRYLNNRYSDNQIYIQLTQPSTGISLRGTPLDGLPDSVFSVYESSKSYFKAGWISNEVIQQITLPQSGTCVGGPFEIKLNINE